MIDIPKHIIDSIKNGKTSLGHHMAFPPDDEEKFIVRIIKKRFSEVSKDIEDFTTDDIKKKMSKYLTKIQTIESNEKGALESLCKGVLNDMFKIPQDTIHINPHLVDKIDSSKERIKPEATDDFEFEDIDSINKLTDEIYKRRMLNALVAGASAYYGNNISNYIKELFNINPELPILYKKLNICNDYLLFTEKDDLHNKNYTDAGTVEVYINGKDDMPRINAYGITFPVMLVESIKGLLEVSCTYGLPDKLSDAQFVMKKADFKLAENWDLRIGYALWELIEENVSKLDNVSLLDVGLNFFFKELSLLSFDEFNTFLQEVFAKTKKGLSLLNDIIDEINTNKERDDFDNYMNDKASEYHQINDSVEEYEYFTPDELCDDGNEFIHSDGNIILNESVSENIYHFTTFKNACKIMEENKLKGTLESINARECGLEYGVSFSRTPLNNIGYVKGSLSKNAIRFCFDGHKLNYKYKGRPISFFGSKNGISAKERERNTGCIYNEYEDRIFLKGQYIDNINQYVTSVDIPLVNLNKTRIETNIDFLLQMESIFNIRLFENESDFNYMRNPISLNEFIEKRNLEKAALDSEIQIEEMPPQLSENISERIKNAEKDVNVEPTEGQINAGNYKKGHVYVNGLDITIENPKGSYRKGVDRNGKQWKQKMNNTYGYIRGYKTVDGDDIDVFLSETPTEGDVYVIDQVFDGKFDEHKCMLGFKSYEDAKKAYLSNYEKGWKGLGSITKVTWNEFKEWVRQSNRKLKPFSFYKKIKSLNTTKVL